MTLSIIIPCYNESTTLREIVSATLQLAKSVANLEIIIVDDHSTDDSREIALQLAAEHTQVKVLFHDVNRGKGAALKTGFLASTGDAVGVQDADLEYNPIDYLKLLSLIAENQADVVFGSRYLHREPQRALRWWHSKMNGFLTMLSNMFSDISLTDMETCYKLFKGDLIREIAPELTEQRFGFEPEIVARIARRAKTRGWRIYERPISYEPRTFLDGKKIGWRDGVRAIWCILKYNLFK